MLAPEDLDAAITQGLITEAQAAGLRELAAKRRHAKALALGHEERFRFMRGFNDFFFASGVLLVGVGASFFAGAAPLRSLVAAAVIWALAELLVGRMRLVLPGILLVLFFAYFASLGLVNHGWLGVAPAPARVLTPFASTFGSLFGYDDPAFAAARALMVTIAGLLFYARFGFPFTLLPVAAGLVLTFRFAALVFLPLAAQPAILLTCGLAVFAAAMAFDISDRERLTRRADCAFWLHLLAAPLIVHSLIALVASDLVVMTHAGAVIIVAIVAVLALVALVIDRRALLVSTLAYLGIVIAYALKAASADVTAIFFATLLILGSMVLALGVGWLPLRRHLMSLVHPALASRLPPVVPAA
jgi:hypothetical protein